jgi:hypothetical protein
MPTQMDVEPLGVSPQFSVGTVKSPCALLISAPLDGTTKPDQLGDVAPVGVAGGSWINDCDDEADWPEALVAVKVNTHCCWIDDGKTLI